MVQSSSHSRSEHSHSQQLAVQTQQRGTGDEEGSGVFVAGFAIVTVDIACLELSTVFVSSRETYCTSNMFAKVLLDEIT